LERSSALTGEVLQEGQHYHHTVAVTNGIGHKSLKKYICNNQTHSDIQRNNTFSVSEAKPRATLTNDR
jgi:hypothetical protein